MTDPTTPAPLDLAALRKIAEAATPGPWVKRDSATGFSVYVISDSKYLAESSWSANSEIYPTIFDAHANFAHIAAFDPPTVLRLIELAESGVPVAVVQELTADRNRHLEQIEKLRHQLQVCEAASETKVFMLAELTADVEHLRQFCYQAAEAAGDHEFVCAETVPLRVEIAALTAERDAIRTKLQTACEALGWYTCECSGRCDIAEWRPANSASCIHARTRAVLAAIKKETQP